MSSPRSAVFEQSPWLWPLLGRAAAPQEGEAWRSAGAPMVMRGGLPRAQNLVSAAQAQTEGSFGFKWAKRDTFESDASLQHLRSWLMSRYGDMREASWLTGADRPLVLDAGCGAAMSAIELFGPVWDRIRYLGCDISEAVDVARERLAERGWPAGLMQADLTRLPLSPGSVDVIFSEGVLHHTDSTRGALLALAPLLRPGGRFMFYVYKKKGPLREFTDDYIRDKLETMAPEAAWNAVMPLTRLGVILGELNAKIRIEEPIELLEIPAGEYDLQRFFYWHVAKAFYRPEMTLDEMNHINFDWYAPRNAHRQTIEEVRAWCAEAGLAIEREQVEEAGITVIAVKVGA
jgi:SAM-dependent methyltransferase